MAEAIPDIKKSRGRPKTNSTGIMLRIEPPMLAKVDAIAKADRVSRPEAIRRLLAKALD